MHKESKLIRTVLKYKHFLDIGHFIKVEVSLAIRLVFKYPATSIEN